VAETASLALPYIIESLSSSPEIQLAIMRMVRKYFYESKTYKRRQLFVTMCSEAINMDNALFFKHFKKYMVALVTDKVISVRMALARVLKHHYVTKLTESLISDRDISLVI
jgi:hypothetical protein